jgi:UDP-glucose 4-epimerase
MLNILIVGGYGNLGVSLSNIKGWNSIKFGREDWKNPDILFSKNIDIVIYCAGELKKQFSQSPVDYIDSNITSFALTLKYINKYNINKFYFISSCAVYGDAISTIEEQPLFPITLNGKIKALLEDLLVDYSLKNKIDYKILRIFNLYGGQDKFSIIFHLKNSLKNKIPFKLFNDGMSRRDYIHVNDVASIIFNLTNINNYPNIINIGTGVSVKISDIVNKFKLSNPSLIIQPEIANEVMLSKADISKLKNLMSCDFHSILDEV